VPRVLEVELPVFPSIAAEGFQLEFSKNRMPTYVWWHLLSTVQELFGAFQGALFYFWP